MNPLNVFMGPTALAEYFDPDRHPPLPLVELPPALNPLRHDGVRIFAKMLTVLPAQNVKSLPALKMLLNEPGAKDKTIVEASSGSTALSLGIIARALWGHEDVRAYVTNKKHPESLKLLRFMGVKPVLYGGLAQQEPSDPRGIMNRLRSVAATHSDTCYPGQYDNDHNWKSHEQWTGAQIYQQLPQVNVFCSTVGTGGCVTGAGLHLKSRKPSVKVLGVCNVFGDPTPGPRHFPGFETSQFPWRETIDAFQTVSSVDSYRTSMQLSRHGIIAGPSSGEALKGLIDYLQAAKDDGRLHELADSATGEVFCVFICADLPYQYMDLYYQKLRPDEFPDIENKDILDCDQDPYDERWFLAADQAAELLLSSMRTPGDHQASRSERAAYESSASVSSSLSASVSSMSASARSGSSFNESTTSLSSMSSSLLAPVHATIGPAELIVLDLRPAEDFASSHVKGSRNIPLRQTQPDFYGTASAVQRRWLEMKRALDEEFLAARDSEEPLDTAIPNKQGAMSTGRRRGGTHQRTVLVVCCDGDSARMATSMLRAKRLCAYSVEGGFAALKRMLDGAEALALC